MAEKETGNVLRLTIATLIQSLGGPAYGGPGPLTNLLSVEGFSIKTSWRVMKLFKQCTAEMADYEQKRIDLCEEYGELNKETGSYEFKTKGKDDPIKIEAFQNAGKELREIEIQVNAEYFTLEDFEIRKFTAPVSQPLTGRDLLVLEWMFEDIMAEIEKVEDQEAKAEAATTEDVQAESVTEDKPKGLKAVK